MNIYEQLQALRNELADRDAQTQTVRLMDAMIKRAESQRESALSFTRLQVLRRVMQMPDALNNEDVRLDLIAMEGDLEDAIAQRSTEPAAYEEDRKPKPKKFYKKK